MAARACRRTCPGPVKFSCSAGPPARRARRWKNMARERIKPRPSVPVFASPRNFWANGQGEKFRDMQHGCRLVAHAAQLAMFTADDRRRPALPAFDHLRPAIAAEIKVAELYGEGAAEKQQFRRRHFPDCRGRAPSQQAARLVLDAEAAQAGAGIVIGDAAGKFSGDARDLSTSARKRVSSQVLAASDSARGRQGGVEEEPGYSVADRGAGAEGPPQHRSPRTRRWSFSPARSAARGRRN